MITFPGMVIILTGGTRGIGGGASLITIGSGVSGLSASCRIIIGGASGLLNLNSRMS